MIKVPSWDTGLRFNGRRILLGSYYDISESSEENQLAADNFARFLGQEIEPHWGCDKITKAAFKETGAMEEKTHEEKEVSMID